MNKLDETYLKRLLRSERERLDMAEHLLTMAGMYKQWATVPRPNSLPPKTGEEIATLHNKAMQCGDFARRVLMTPITDEKEAKP